MHRILKFPDSFAHGFADLGKASRAKDVEDDDEDDDELGDTDILKHSCSVSLPEKR